MVSPLPSAIPVACCMMHRNKVLRWLCGVLHLGQSHKTSAFRGPCSSNGRSKDYPKRKLSIAFLLDPVSRISYCVLYAEGWFGAESVRSHLVEVAVSLAGSKRILLVW